MRESHKRAIKADRISDLVAKVDAMWRAKLIWNLSKKSFRRVQLFIERASEEKTGIKHVWLLEMSIRGPFSRCTNRVFMEYLESSTLQLRKNLIRMRWLANKKKNSGRNEREWGRTRKPKIPQKVRLQREQKICLDFYSLFLSPPPIRGPS